MKLLIVFNELDDVVFYQGQRKYLSHVLRYFRHESGFDSSGGTSGEDIPNDPDVLNLMVQNFAPLLASQKIMVSQLGKVYHSIDLEDGMSVHLRQIDDFNVVALCAADELPDAAEQLRIFDKIIKAFFGPCFEQLKPANLDARKGVWKFVQAVFDAWMRLYNRDFAYLFECVEVVVIPQNAPGGGQNNCFRGKSMEALEKAVQKYKLAADLVQVYIICGTKRFCLYTPEGKGMDLTPGDYLLMCATAKILFPQLEFDGHREEFQSCKEDEDEEFYSSKEAAEDEAFTENQPKSQSHRKNAAFYFPIVLNVEYEDFEYKIVSMMLHTEYSPFTPHRIHFIKLHQEVIFVGVETSTDCFNKAAGGVFHSLGLLKSAIKGQESGELWFQSLKSHSASLESAVTFSKNDRAHNAFVNVKSFLTKLKATKFVENFSGEMNATCETILNNLNLNIKNIFSSLFLQFPPVAASQICTRILKCSTFTGQMMKDFLDFLVVKARRNLAATSIQTRYPGLVQFVWIDRQREELISPSPDFDQMPAGFGDRMWKRLAWCRREAQKVRFQNSRSLNMLGGSTVTVVFCRDTALQYCYHLLPDTSNNASTASHIPFLNSAPNEFCLVHLACVPTAVVNQHHSQLMERIRERTMSSVSSLIE